MTKRNLAPSDAELIAAFIDKKLSGEERQAFMERLDKEEALYEVFVETVRFRDQESGRGAEVVEHLAGRRRWFVPAAAAALLALAVTPLLIRNLSSKSYAEALVADGRLDEHLGEGWYEQGWSEMRGVQPGRDEVETAFRLGVRVVDLEVALRTGNLGDALILIGRIHFQLGEVDLSGPLRSSYSELQQRIEAGEGADSALALAETAETYVGDYLSGGDRFYQLGKWAEAGNLAARSGNRHLLGSRPFVEMLDEFRRHVWTERIDGDLARLSKTLGIAPEELDLLELEEAFVSIIRQSDFAPGASQGL